MTNTILGPEEVVTKYGVPPELIIDFLALMGDSSDNIPASLASVKKPRRRCCRGWVGWIRCTRIRQNRRADLPWRKTMAGKLEENKEVAYLSYQLATIKTDVELELGCEQLKCSSLR
jgi:DNA polymerase-1